MKFVLNKCYGGFGLSDWATKQDAVVQVFRNFLLKMAFVE